MSISLQKGQKVDLTKGNSGLNKIMIGLGWDENEEPKKKGGMLGGLFKAQKQDIDCDASAILCKGGKFTDGQDVIYFGNLRHASGAVIHQGDNLTGAGDGDDEQILVELNKVPREFDKIVFVVNIYQAIQRNQHFGMIKNAFIRIVDTSNNTELCKFNLSESYDNMYALIFGEVYRNGDEWKFNAMGQATQDPGLGELCNRFQ